MTSHTHLPTRTLNNLADDEQLKNEIAAAEAIQPKANPGEPDLSDLPIALRAAISTAFMLTSVLNLHENEVRDFVAIDYMNKRSRDNDLVGRQFAVLMRWAATLAQPAFRLSRNWRPEPLPAVATRLLNVAKREAPERLKEMLKDLRDVDLIDDAKAGKLLLG